jgi:hypothetical protein
MRLSAIDSELMAMKRADVQKWSQAATSKTLSEVSKQQSPLRVLDLPGVRDLEGRLLLYAGDPHRVEDEVARASRQLFGIGLRDTELEVPDEYWNLPESSPERRRIETLYAEHENRFETGDDLTDDEAMEILARFGLDFSDDRGQLGK